MKRKKDALRLPAEVVCFDLSGTIADWNGAFRSAFEEAVKEWIGRWDQDNNIEESIQNALNKYHSARKEGRSNKESLKAALSLLPTGADERIIAHVASSIRALHPEKARFVNGAEEMLRSLSSRYRLAVITNLDEERAKAVWEALKLHRFMKEEDLFSATRGLRKPSIRLYRHASEKLGVPASSCVMVGNSYRQDIAGALASGWQAVWVRTGGKDAGGIKLRSRRGRIFYVIRTVRLLPRLLNKEK